MKELLKALSKFQSEITPIIKDAKNPFYKSDYASLEHIQEHIKPVLINCGLILIQKTINNECGLFVETNLIHVESAETETSIFPVIVQKTDAQSYGSAVSYAKRYSISGLLNLTIQDADDDGNGAGKDEKKKEVVNTKEQPKDDTAGISKLLENSATLAILSANYKSLSEENQKKFASLTTAIKAKLSNPKQ
jgi:hypothetical protein